MDPRAIHGPVRRASPGPRPRTSFLRTSTSLILGLLSLVLAAAVTFVTFDDLMAHPDQHQGDQPAAVAQGPDPS